MYRVFTAPFYAIGEELVRPVLAGVLASMAGLVAGAYWLGRKRGR